MQDTKTVAPNKKEIKFFDKFTKIMLGIMFAILIFIFASGMYMNANKMEGGGTDDVVNSLGSQAAHTEAHPFIELPGDAEVSAFSVANFFVGIIIGHNWEKLFGSKRKENGAPEENGEEK
jgi:hypothetical protein